MRFLLVGMSLLGAFHFYAWVRWVRDPAWGAAGFWALTAVVVSCWLSVPVTLTASRRFPQRVARVWAWPGYLWLGTVFLAPFVLLGVDLSRLLLRWASHGLRLPGPLEAMASLSDRNWALSSLAGVTALVLYSVWRARARPRVERVEVRLARLPEALDGLTLVQLSDVHVGLTLGRGFVRDLVDAVNALEPDLVAITGDLVDGPVERLREAVAPLAELSAPHGVFFVTGNHEYYAGAAAWCEHLSSLGLRVLRNERVSIGTGEASFDLAGIDDASAHRFQIGHGADLANALEGRDPSRELVLLAHQPRALADARAAGVGLQISGHTHGGQIWPFNWLVPLQQPVTAGLRSQAGTQIYVSRGTGYWGPPMRLGSPPEISQIVLRAQRATNRTRDHSFAPRGSDGRGATAAGGRTKCWAC